MWYELRWGITACVLLTVSLITLIFYYYPSTTDALLFFRTITILPESGGRVDEVFVKDGQTVNAGDPLFNMHESSQLTAQVIRPGTLAEVFCLYKPFKVVPMLVTYVQDVIASGQLRPTDSIIDIQHRARPGTLTVWLEPLFLGIFQHTSVKTPQWLGYIVQRPESHTIHHGKGLHKYNYSDLPVFDLMFGTFRNPKTYEMDTSFYHGASARIVDMLLCRDISTQEQEPSDRVQVSEIVQT